MLDWWAAVCHMGPCPQSNTLKKGSVVYLIDKLKYKKPSNKCTLLFVPFTYLLWRSAILTITKKSSESYQISVIVTTVKEHFIKPKIMTFPALNILYQLIEIH